MKELRQRFAGRKVMLGVDRLDMIKGIPQKILAFEKLRFQRGQMFLSIKSLQARFMRLLDALMGIWYSNCGSNTSSGSIS
ncbi:hypothetical protein SLA2020_276930 [Shorea laevis]